MADTDDDEGNHQTARQFGVKFPLDEDGYLRRCCAQCGLHFKQKADATQLADPAAPEVVEHLADEVDEGPKAMSWCPYCGHVAEGREFFTEEQRRHAHAVLTRETVEPLLEELSARIDDMFKGFNRGPLRVTSTGTRAPRSTRPLAGPEANDMQVVEATCCGEAFKILEGWRETAWCPGCGSSLILD